MHKAKCRRGRSSIDFLQLLSSWSSFHRGHRWTYLRCKDAQIHREPSFPQTESASMNRVMACLSAASTWISCLSTLFLPSILLALFTYHLALMIQEAPCWSRSWCLPALSCLLPWRKIFIHRISHCSRISFMEPPILDTRLKILQGNTWVCIVQERSWGSCQCRREGGNRCFGKPPCPRKPWWSWDSDALTFHLEDQMSRFEAICESSIFRYESCFQSCWEL